jgi:hypothetical protein
MQTFTELKNNITTICQLFKLGELVSYKTENHALNGFKIAKFETNLGNYEYIFKTN